MCEQGLSIAAVTKYALITQSSWEREESREKTLSLSLFNFIFYKKIMQVIFCSCYDNIIQFWVVVS